MSQVTELLTLQEFDDQAAALQSALDEVERRLSGDEELDAARRLASSVQAVVAPLREDRDRLDLQVQALAAKITQEETKLYSGTVTNSKELRNIQHEVDSLKEQRVSVEDKLLDIELRFDAANRDSETAFAAVTVLEAARATGIDGWTRQSATLNESIRRINARREAQRAQVSPAALAVYERVRLRRNGNAVAKIQGSTCAACRVSMPDSVRKQIFRPDSLVQCPNCERILYLG